MAITDRTLFVNGSDRAGGGIFNADQLNIGATILGGSTGGDCDNYKQGFSPTRATTSRMTPCVGSPRRFALQDKGLQRGFSLDEAFEFGFDVVLDGLERVSDG
jgi:hypothetical protein